MHAELVDGEVRCPRSFTDRFHHPRSYGRVTADGALALQPAEAAHLLARGDLDAVETPDGACDLAGFLAVTDAATAFVVYRDLRARGFYCSPTAAGYPGAAADSGDLAVYPRGAGHADGEIAFTVTVCDDRAAVAPTELGDAVLGVVDEDAEVTYFAPERLERPPQAAPPEPPATPVPARLLPDRVLVDSVDSLGAPAAFYGQPLRGRDATVGPLQLSLVEAGYLAAAGWLALDADAVTAAAAARIGPRYAPLAAAYAQLRAAGYVPKSGFKFGADFRVYPPTADDPTATHSAELVHVRPADEPIAIRELSLHVRLAGGVRKRMVFAFTTAAGAIRWVAIARITP